MIQAKDKISIHLRGAIITDVATLSFWSILNPEKPEEDFDTTKADGVAGVIIVGAYSFLVVIILLNLLIALMNATIGKTQDRKHLYWKFVRTCIWIDFFGEAMALPPPFNLVAVCRSCVKGVYVNVVERLKKRRAKLTV